MSTKYGNKKTGKYDSKKEAAYATVLHALQKAGKISALKEQVRFVLIPSQYIDGKCVERSLTYIADFTYIGESGKLHVADVKGVLTDVYKMKRKMMLFFHEIRIEEV
jgi:hypothetical protein